MALLLGPRLRTGSGKRAAESRGEAAPRSAAGVGQAIRRPGRTRRSRVAASGGEDRARLVGEPVRAGPLELGVELLGGQRLEARVEPVEHEPPLR